MKIKPQMTIKQIEAEIERLRKAGKPTKFAIGGKFTSGLYIKIIGNSATYVLILKLGKRRNKKGQLVDRRIHLGLGSFYKQTFEEVLHKVAHNRILISKGVDPTKKWGIK